MNNHIRVDLSTIPENVSLARIIVTGFLAPLDPTMDEVSDIKTAVSEAVTNAIIHGYDGYEKKDGMVGMALTVAERNITIEISDKGIGIKDPDAAREPMFTTKPDLERSGLGFTVMESFMDSVEIKSTLGAGTTVVLSKKLKKLPEAANHG